MFEADLASTGVAAVAVEPAERSVAHAAELAAVRARSQPAVRLVAGLVAAGPSQPAAVRLAVEPAADGSW